MKVNNIAFMLIMFCAACVHPGNEDLNKMLRTKAQQYLKTQLTDSSFYHPVSFSSPDSIMYSYLNDVVYLQYDDSVSEVEATRFREMGENFALYKQREKTGYYNSRLAYFKGKRDSVANTIEPDFAGYNLEHQFKTVSSTGDSVIRKYIFCFDKNGNLFNVIK
ncbi:hypothetical protein DJ568_13390 [Mucilaginibacter hurinus]|uniref:Uncharacterized protein n=1 Tax=Mucilaginibacter hurinus TaxID=2201324 RepID=A0A367GLD8_9SPHI|nr:hypothetical protein [Mucilaginibacter hurinus]RCH54284.1 hypothetical protein DJ568_13390 [Mucilaginibacter hurinus]